MTAKALRALLGRNVPVLLLPQGSPHPAHSSGSHVSPPGPSVPSPETPQQGRSPPPRNPALPSHWPLQARPTCWPMSWPSPIPAPSPGRYPTPRAGRAPLPPRLPCSWLGRWDGPWLPGPVLTDPWGAPNPRGQLACTVPWQSLRISNINYYNKLTYCPFPAKQFFKWNLEEKKSGKINKSHGCFAQYNIFFVFHSRNSKLISDHEHISQYK